MLIVCCPISLDFILKSKIHQARIDDFDVQFKREISILYAVLYWISSLDSGLRAHMTNFMWHAYIQNEIIIMMRVNKIVIHIVVCHLAPSKWKIFICIYGFMLLVLHECETRRDEQLCFDYVCQCKMNDNNESNENGIKCVRTKANGTHWHTITHRI